MYCRSCGHETNGARFCPECGTEQIAPQAQQPNPGTYQQQQQPYTMYSSNAPQQPVADMTIGQWMVTILISIIPLVGLICMLIWACGSPGDKPSRKNWAAANLIWTLILIVIYVIFAVVLVAAAGSKS